MEDNYRGEPSENKRMIHSRLSPDLLVSAYCQGVFPMAHDDGEIYWFDPDPRAILPLNSFHVSRSLKRTLKKRPFRLTINHAFDDVITACAASAPDRPKTWINDEIKDAYIALHELGLAHSVEAWQDGQLVGGLYGVAIQGLFAGESMFSLATDSSKITLVCLVNQLRQRRFRLLDIQFMTDHLRRFGAIEIPAWEYRRRLQQALQVDTSFVDL